MIERQLPQSSIINPKSSIRLHAAAIAVEFNVQTRAVTEAVPPAHLDQPSAAAGQFFVAGPLRHQQHPRRIDAVQLIYDCPHLLYISLPIDDEFELII